MNGYDPVVAASRVDAHIASTAAIVTEWLRPSPRIRLSVPEWLRPSPRIRPPVPEWLRPSPRIRPSVPEWLDSEARPWRTCIATVSGAPYRSAAVKRSSLGERAPAWLLGQRLHARLVDSGGAVRRVGGWPEPGAPISSI